MNFIQVCEQELPGRMTPGKSGRRQQLRLRQSTRPVPGRMPNISVAASAVLVSAACGGEPGLLAVVNRPFESPRARGR